MSLQIFNKRKTLVDNIIVASLIVSIFVWVFSSPLLIIMSALVYPMSCLFIYGLVKISRVFRVKELTDLKKGLLLILGVVSILFSSFMLILVFSTPPIPLRFIIYFLSLPLFLIGFAGLLKGFIVTVYSPLQRKINVAIGIFTLLFISFAVLTAETLFMLNLISLSGLIIVNSLIRAALYLSEYGLVLNSVKNLKLTFYIMESIGVPQKESDPR